jgi:hypothetical protein
MRPRIKPMMTEESIARLHEDYLKGGAVMILAQTADISVAEMYRNFSRYGLPTRLDIKRERKKAEKARMQNADRNLRRHTNCTH